MSGETVSHFEILECLGQGGMGVVYKARDLKLDRLVALKFLPPHLGTEEAARQRFAREAKTASALDHGNICTIYEIGEAEDGRTFIAMAYCDGETLSQRIARGPMPVDEAVNIARHGSSRTRRVSAGPAESD
jgi:serine/threonine-protein kinase